MLPPLHSSDNSWWTFCLVPRVILAVATLRMQIHPRCLTITGSHKGAYRRICLSDKRPSQRWFVIVIQRDDDQRWAASNENPSLHDDHFLVAQFCPVSPHPSTHSPMSFVHVTCFINWSRTMFTYTDPPWIESPCLYRFILRIYIWTNWLYNLLSFDCALMSLVYYVFYWIR